jgi:hypothetical protein
MMPQMAWTVETLNGTVDAELTELPADSVVGGSDNGPEMSFGDGEDE